MQSKLAALQNGHCHDPFAVLGRHGNTIRAFMPTAEHVEIADVGKCKRLPNSDIFEFKLNQAQALDLPRHYSLRWQEKGTDAWHQAVSAYSFHPLIPEHDLHLFGEGRHHHIYRYLGAHLAEVDGVQGCLFAVWAPGVKRVSVVGDFNGWNGLRHPMRNRGSSGVWEIFVPGLHQGDLYKFEILNQHSHIVLKADPYGQAMTKRPDTASVITDSDYEWQDLDWMQARPDWNWQAKPMSIYEVHIGSWKRHSDGRFYNYREFAEDLVGYVTQLNYTHIELLPVMEHPLDESWGYQVSGYFAATSRFGSPDDLRYLIDHCHANGIGVILDWVPGHFPKDDFALARFTGEATYEHADPRRGEHQDWGTLIFDYGRNEVYNFLLANAIYWFEEFHVDGLRVDAVASMLYLDYSRNDGEWLPNRYGGRENIEAIEFLREMNAVIHARYPGALTIAEESTAWPMISRPTWMGGLGFSMKWNMGWMNDTLAYIENDPIHRKYHHDKLTFSQLYAYSENFVLPLSHDEVVHMKKSLADKMPGDGWQKLANLRLLLAWQIAHPGKKLMFMGGELAQWSEWDESQQIHWHLLQHGSHQGIRDLLSDLNALYRDEEALHRFDFDQQGFEWVDCHDSEQSVLLFMRHSEKETVACFFNFTPLPRENYRVGLPKAGTYKELINTDAGRYGGSNCGNEGRVDTEDKTWMGFPCSVALTLPPLGAVFIKLQDQ